MANEPRLVRRDKATREEREQGSYYVGIVVGVRSDNRVTVRIPSLQVTIGPVMPLNATTSNPMSKGDSVLCAFTDYTNSTLVVFGTLNIKQDQYLSATSSSFSIDNLTATSASIGTLTVTGASTLTVLGSSFLSASTTIGTISPTELSYLDGLTSGVQAQVNSKAPSASPTFTGTVVLPSTTSIGIVSDTEIEYLDGVTSAIQTQINSKAPSANPAFTGNVSVGGELTYHPTPETSSVGFTIQLAQDGKIVKLTNATSASVTIPLSSSVSFPIGSQVTLIRYGTGSVSVVGSGSVAVRATPGPSLRAQYSSLIALKIDSDEWILMGDLT